MPLIKGQFKYYEQLTSGEFAQYLKDLFPKDITAGRFLLYVAAPDFRMRVLDLVDPRTRKLIKKLSQLENSNLIQQTNNS